MGVKRKPAPKDWFNIIVIILLIGLFMWLFQKYVQTVGYFDSKDPLSAANNLRLFILTFGHVGFAVMIGLHALHVIVSVIPSVVVQFTGGLVYGMGLGMLSGLIGIIIGTFVSFYLSRLLGRRVVALFVSKEKLQKIDTLANSAKVSLVLLLLFILPVPKDFLAYLAGLTKIKASLFFLISTIGRLPGMLIATYLGSHLLQRHFPLLGLIVAACAITALFSLIYREKLMTLALSITSTKAG
ncbi:MAG: VTT domain-containing protein [Clostridiales bacterium]|nr:VTT domain-containing protein [Clostridiales bacterium]